MDIQIIPRAESEKFSDEIIFFVIKSAAPVQAANFRVIVFVCRCKAKRFLPRHQTVAIAAG
jgi:hypothetical protein